MRHLVALKYYSRCEIEALIKLAIKIKGNFENYSEILKGKNVGLIFEKPSLRTKTAFYIGALQLGAGAIYYSPLEIQLGKREKVTDVSATLAEFLDAVVLRTFSHNNILEFARSSKVPIINALSDFSHPSQALADIMTIYENKGNLKKVKVTYLGDGNNVCNSLLYAFAILGGRLTIACPDKYQPAQEVLDEVKMFSRISKASIDIVSSAQKAVADSDVIYTDVWTSMGKESETKIRDEIFKPYQINDDLLKRAKNDCIVMHCLPAHRGREITDSVMDSKHSVVFQQAANRLHTAKAILAYLIAKAD